MSTPDPLDDFVEGPGAPAAPPPRGAIKKVSYSHSAMIDMILVNPMISQNQLAAHFGYSASWISTVMASDAFKAQFAKRAAETVDPVMMASIKEQFEGLVLRSLEIMREKLSRPSSQIPDQLALRSFELTTRAAGYGARVEQTNVQVNVDTHLDLLGERLTQLLAKKRVEALDAPLDGEIVP